MLREKLDLTSSGMRTVLSNLSAEVWESNPDQLHGVYNTDSGFTERARGALSAVGIVRAVSEEYSVWKGYR